MKYILLFVGLFLFLCTNSLSAQSGNDTLVAWQYYQKADSLLQARKMDSSIVYFNRALSIYEKNNMLERMAASYNGLSDSQLRIYKINDALVNAKKALTICQEHFSEDHVQAAYAYDNIAKSYLISRDIDKALELYNKALEIRTKILPEIHFDKAKSYSNLALIYTHTSKYPKALLYNNKALEIMLEVLGPDHPKNGIIYNNLGVISDRMGRFDEAIKYHKKKIEIMSKVYGEENLSVTQAYVNLGSAFQNMNMGKEALNYYDLALNYYKNNSVNNNDVAVIYNNMGGIFRDNGEYDKALRYYEKSLKIYTEILGESNAKLSSQYLNIGGLYNVKNENDKALFYYHAGLDLLKKVSKDNLQIESKLHLNIGNAYRDQGRYNLALESYQKSTTVLINIFGKEHNMVMDNYSLISDIYIETGDYKNSNLFLDKALTILEYKTGQYNPITTIAIDRIAKVYFKQKKYDEAIVFYNRALELNTKKDRSFVKRDEFALDHYYDLQVLLSTLKGKADSFLSLYEIHKNKNLVDSSLVTYRKADSLLFKLNQTYQSHKDKISLAEKRNRIYEASIRLQLILEGDFKDKKALSKAFYYSERSKSGILQELLADIELNNDFLLPEAMSYFNRNLKVNKSRLQSQIINLGSEESADSLKISEFENQLFDINRKQDSLTTVIETNYPKYYNLKYQNKVISVADIQSKLDEQTTLLEFFTSDSTTYAFTITKSSIDVQELATPDLANKVNGFNQSITSKELKAYKTYGYELYQELVSPIASKIKGNQLIIVPDGPLWHLNFDLLLAERSDANNPKELPYLVKEYIISYANSATLLFDAFKEPKREDVAEECLAFSFTDSTSIEQTKTMSLAALRDTGDDLPGTREEIKAISNIIDGEYYFGSQAIETNFKKNANKYNILHLALHGEVDNERPENSRLFFTKSNDTIEDNFLYSHELFALDIPAELTVLSACNTGSGKIAKGEGIMSLGNAFQYAGTKSLLLTSWEVSDQTTPELMKYFYTNLKKGMNKAEALQQAKLQYINTADVNRVAPFYWGGFYLVGDPEPIQFADNNWWYWLIAGVMVMLILLLIRKTKRG